MVFLLIHVSKPLAEFSYTIPFSQFVPVHPVEQEQFPGDTHSPLFRHPRGQIAAFIRKL